jgi:threonine dehydrogenase-like Zn-dependent dehydrogenase
VTAVEVPETMAAAVYREKGVLEVVDVDTPAVGPHDVLLEVSHCGVCGSDLHMVLEGWGVPDAIEGHEYTGVVAAVGSEVTRWAVGQHVVAGPSRRCGECDPCLAGRPSLCLRRGDVGTGNYQGAFARYSLTHEDEVLALPDGLTLREAALAEPLAVALHGITQAQVEPHHRVIVFGAGPIGALTAAALVAKGVTDLTVVEPGEVRQELARAIGASRVVTPDQLDSPGWHPGHLVDEPYDRAIECSGHRAAMEQALGQLGRMGRLVFVGAGIDGPRFDANRIMLNEIEITGAFVYDATGFEDALALLPQLPLEHLIEPVDVSLPGLFDAMVRLAAGELAGKVMVTPGGTR